MSKRYGRNQRRKHRERIAELETATRAADVIVQQLAAEADRLTRQIEDWDTRIRSILGPYNVLRLSMPKVYRDDLPERGFEAPIPQRTFLGVTGPEDRHATLTRWVAEVDLFLHRSEWDQAMLGGLMQFELIDRFGFKALGMAHRVDRETLWPAFMDARYRQHLVEQLASNFTELAKQQRPRR